MEPCHEINFIFKFIYSIPRLLYLFNAVITLFCRCYTHIIIYTHLCIAIAYTPHWAGTEKHVVNMKDLYYVLFKVNMNAKLMESLYNKFSYFVIYWKQTNTHRYTPNKLRYKINSVFIQTEEEKNKTNFCNLLIGQSLSTKKKTSFFRKK